MFEPKNAESIETASARPHRFEASGNAISTSSAIMPDTAAASPALNAFEMPVISAAHAPTIRSDKANVSKNRFMQSSFYEQIIDKGMYFSCNFAVLKPVIVSR